MDEVALEARMLREGVARYVERTASAKGAGHGGHTRTGSELVAHIAEAVLPWVTMVAGSPPNRRVPRVLCRFAPEVSSAVAAHALVDALCVERASVTRVAMAISGALQDAERFALTLAAEGNMELLVRRRMRRQSAGGRLRSIRRMAREHGKAKWPHPDRAAVGLALLYAMVETSDIVTIEMVEAHGRKIRQVALTADVSKWMEERDGRRSRLFPFYLPMVVPPVPWEGLWGGGYQTAELAIRPLTRWRYGKVPDAVPAMVLAAVNAIQETGWRIDEAVLATAKALWASGAEEPLFPVRDRRVPKTTKEENREARIKAGRLRAGLGRIRASERSRLLRALRTINVAESFTDSPLYHVQHFDSRGRVYPFAVALSSHGDDLTRGMLALGTPERLTPEGMEALLCYAGSLAIGSRASRAERLAWANAHPWDDVQRDPAGSKAYWALGDEPWQLLQAGLDIARARKGEAVRARVVKDATSSVAQIHAILTGDATLARLSNVTPSAKPQDLYGALAEAARASMARRSPESLRDWLQILGGVLPRDLVKPVGVAYPYGVTYTTVYLDLVDWFDDLVARRGIDPLDASVRPRRLLDLAAALWGACERVLAPSKALHSWAREVARRVGAKPIEWTAHDGFAVRHEVHRQSSAIVETGVFGKVRRATINIEKEEINGQAQGRSLLVHLTHSIESSIAREWSRRMRARGIRDLWIVHDSYGTHANHVGALDAELRNAYEAVFAWNPLDRFIREIGLPLQPQPRFGTLAPSCVQDARHLAI